MPAGNCANYRKPQTMVALVAATNEIALTSRSNTCDLSEPATGPPLETVVWSLSSSRGCRAWRGSLTDVGSLYPLQAGNACHEQRRPFGAVIHNGTSVRLCRPLVQGALTPVYLLATTMAKGVLSHAPHLRGTPPNSESTASLACIRCVGRVEWRASSDG